MKTPIAKTGDAKGVETEGEAGSLPKAEAAEDTPRRRPGGPPLGGKARAMRLAARGKGGDNVTPLAAGRRGADDTEEAEGALTPRARAVVVPTAVKRIIIQPDGPLPVAPAAKPQPAAGPARGPGQKPQGAGQRAQGAGQTQPIPVPRPVVTVQAAQMQMRHYILMALFAALVLLPSALYGTYLYTVAVDQYESNVGFGSRTEQASNTFDILGVLGGGSGAATKDMDILNQFVTSQELVSRVDQKLDLRKIWSRHPEDWMFAFPADGPIEDLVDYWNKMVVVNYDNSTGLMSLKVYAFAPEDAQAIAAEIVLESGDIINELSKTAQEDTTRYSRDTLAKAEGRYRQAQNELADFRVKNRIVDPQLQLNGASQIVNGLVQQMAEAQINLELLRGQVADTDPRISQLTRRIEVIEKRISEETSKVGTLGDPTDPGYASLIRDYQNLQMEMEFSQKSYMAAQGAYDQAQSDAQQQTHYLATFLSPTVAQSSTAPDRPLHILLTALAGLLAWSSISMIYYALRDRR